MNVADSEAGELDVTAVDPEAVSPSPESKANVTLTVAVVPVSPTNLTSNFPCAPAANAAGPVSVAVTPPADAVLNSEVSAATVPAESVRSSRRAVSVVVDVVVATD